MTLNKVVLVANILLVLVPNIVNAQAQVSQSEIARQLQTDNRDERARALRMAQAIGAQGIDTELREALISALEVEGRLHMQRVRGEIEPLDNPLLVAKLANFVIEFRDSRSIPGLTGALGMAPPVIFALADFGEPAVQPVLDIVASTDDGSVLMDALATLRFMVEGAEARPLSTTTLSEIRGVAERFLTGEQSVVTVWRAIDLAVALDDPGLRRTVESLASDVGAVFARGISEPDLVFKTQKRAADRLAGDPPLPRHPNR